jgi:hypothetical protein
MKNITKIVPGILIRSVLATVLAGSSASANQFTGSIAFSSSGVTTDNPSLQSATTFGLTGAFTTQTTGEYSLLGIVDFQPVTFNGFRFNPPVASVLPLWSLTIGTTVASFDATTVTSLWDTTVGGGEWVITGRGMASITGFTDTPGTWTVNLSDSGNRSIAFDATADANPRGVPDGGSTMTLLGGAIMGLSMLARKFAC